MEAKFSNLEELKAVLKKALSTNGYFIKTDKEIPIRTSLVLSFSVSGHDEKLEIQSEVVYVGSGGVGVNFIENTNAIKNKTGKFLNAILGPQSPAPPQPEPTAEVKTPSQPVQTATLSSSDTLRTPPAQAETQLPPEPTRVIKGKMKNVLKLESSGEAGKKNLLADFGEISFAKILLSIFEGKSSGIIRLKGRDIENTVYFRNGRPVFVESNPPPLEESIGHILLTKEKIKKEDLENAIKYVEENGVRIGEALMRLKLVSPTLLKDALTFQLKTKLYELFKWKEADFEMEMMSRLTHKFGTRPINVINTIYRGLKERLKELYPADLEPYISPIYNQFLVQKESTLFDIESLGFNNPERRFWDLMLNGKRRVRKIFEGSPMNKPETFRFLYALLELDLVNINDHETLDIPNIERDLHHQARYMEKMNHFDVLQVHWSANKEKIENAYKKHLNAILEKKNLPNLSHQAVQDIDSIANIMKKAFDVLMQDSDRREYRKEILGESESKIAAELAARQAQLAEFKNDMKEARSLIEVAMDLNPANSEYKLLYRKYGGRIR